MSNTLMNNFTMRSFAGDSPPTRIASPHQAPMFAPLPIRSAGTANGNDMSSSTAAAAAFLGRKRFAEELSGSWGVPPQNKKMFTGAAANLHPSSAASTALYVDSMKEAYLRNRQREAGAMAALKAASNGRIFLNQHRQSGGAGGINEQQALLLAAFSRETQRLNQERTVQQLLRQSPLYSTLSQTRSSSVHQAHSISHSPSPVSTVDAAFAAALDSKPRHVSAPPSPPQVPRDQHKEPSTLQEVVAVTPTNMQPMPLASEEDANWLSDFHVFLRKELVEVCFATEEDVATRNISQQVVLNQVGIRCRCCKNAKASERAPRSMAFPSSIAQIYQSFTMMLREHFNRCLALDGDLKKKFIELKEGKTTQGAVNSKEYWEYSARKLGMVDSANKGIALTEDSQARAIVLPSYGGGNNASQEKEEPIMLLCADEKTMVSSDYLVTLLEQVQRVHLLPEECRGNRKTLKIGLPGMSCKHCCQAGRFGLSRVFPVKKRTLSSKLEDMYQHLLRCTVCPEETRKALEGQRKTGEIDISEHQELYDLVWSRLRKGPETRGKTADPSPVKSN